MQAERPVDRRESKETVASKGDAAEEEEPPEEEEEEAPPEPEKRFCQALQPSPFPHNGRRENRCKLNQCQTDLVSK